uniref:Secreted protein n=1 Tax=Heterorhabditis bacteriophora TaxID=37862 RepID=A0A1I7WI91_HETBA
MLKITILRLSMLHICDSIQCIFVSFTIEVKHTRVSHAPSLCLNILNFTNGARKCYILYSCYNCLILIVLLSLCVLRNKGYHTTNKLRVASPPSRPAWQE